MKKLQEQINVERLPFADVSYWSETPIGIRLATLETASFALLSVAGGSGESGARFALPDDRAELERAIKALSYVFALGRAYQASEVARTLGVSVSTDLHHIAAAEERA